MCLNLPSYKYLPEKNVEKGMIEKYKVTQSYRLRGKQKIRLCVQDKDSVRRQPGSTNTKCILLLIHSVSSQLFTKFCFQNRTMELSFYR